MRNLDAGLREGSVDFPLRLQQVLSPLCGMQSSVGFDCASELPIERGSSVRATANVSASSVHARFGKRRNASGTHSAIPCRTRSRTHVSVGCLTKNRSRDRAHHFPLHLRAPLASAFSRRFRSRERGVLGGVGRPPGEPLPPRQASPIFTAARAKTSLQVGNVEAKQAHNATAHLALCRSHGRSAL